ncbi:MAG: type II secretory pathway component PulK [Lentimonas sp.]|jgi:type II secretory pathway component PulK
MHLKPATKRGRNTPQRQSGAVLILVLGLVFACTLMVIAFVQSAMSEIRYASQSARTADLRPHAYSALQITLASLREYELLNAPLYGITADLENAVDESGIEFPENIKVSVQVEDCAGKIGIGALTERDDWLDLIEPLQFSIFDLEPLVDSILDWMDADDNARPFGAETSDYVQEDLLFTPPNSPISNLDELRYVRGCAEFWYDASGQPGALPILLKSLLSPYHASPPNINTAPAAVLQYLTGDADAVQNILDFRYGGDAIPATADDRFFENEGELSRHGVRLVHPCSFQALNFIINIAIHSSGAQFKLSALIGTGSNLTGSEENSAAIHIIQVSEYSGFSKTAAY